MSSRKAKFNRRSARVGTRGRLRIFSFEVLEPRIVMAANASPFPQITWTTQANGLPNLTSFPTAPAMIYLDYDGDAAQNISETDFDDTPGEFTSYEQQRIYEHWRGLSDTFSMFNVGVTTVQPAANVPTQWIAITNDMITKGGFNGVDTFPDTEPSGQSGSDWHAEGYSHELSHGFGNWHQASYDELGNKLDEYAPFPMNDPLRAGIMGDGGGTIIKWQYGHSSLDASTIQADMDAIVADLNALDGSSGDGFRPDDQLGTSTATATALTVVDTTTQAKIGIIERITDQDWHSFTSSGGTYNIMVGRDNPSPVDVKVSIFNSAGTLIATDDGDPITSATSGSSNYRTLVNDTHLTMNLAVGIYYIKVESHGNYADLGQYIVRVDRMLDGWQAEDIGLVESPGFTEYDPTTATFTVGGSGKGLGGTVAQGGDQAHFAYKKMTGSGEIIVRVTSMETIQSVIRAGIVVRESLATGSKFFAAYAKPTGGVAQQRRNATDANSSTLNSSASFNFSPVWLKIKRVKDAVNDTFSAYYSTNGTTWTLINTAQAITMTDEVYVGLVSTSANDLDRLTANFLSKATFTNVQVIQQADIGNTGGFVGSTTYNSAGDAYTLVGRGFGWGNIAAQLDSSYNYYHSLAGDGSITVRVASVSSSSVTSGVFIRETVAQNSKYFAAWVKPNQGTVRSLRIATSGISNEIAVTPASYWLRIERVGNLFRSYTSDDGIAWTQFGGDQVIAMNAKVLIGLMVASGNTSTNNTTTFDNLVFTGGIDTSVPVSALPAPTNVSVSNVTSTSANVTWVSPNVNVPGDANLDGIVDAADFVLWRKNDGPQADYDAWRANFGKVKPTITGFTVERSIDNVNFEVIGTTAAGVLTLTDSTLTGAQKYYYRVRTNDAFGSSTPSSVVTATARVQAVTGLKVYSTSTTQLVVEWFDTSGETDYTLQRSTTGLADSWSTIGSTTINRNTTIYIDNNRAVGTKYYYQVISVDSTGTSATSNVVSAYTRINSTPLNFTFSSTSSTSTRFSWDALAGMTKYAVYRGRDNSTNEWQLLNANVTTPTYTDSGLTAGKEYYYRIVGYDANNAPSKTATILGWPGLTTPALPTPWITQDIGAVGISGVAGYSSGTFTIIGGGADIWGNSDEFRYVYAPLSGDGFIQAHIDSARDPTANFYSRAGLQIRETTATNSKQVSLMLHETDGGVRLQARSGTGGGTGETLGPIVTSPYWLRLERVGNTITGKVSPDNVTWTTVGSYNVSMTTSVLIGMALTPRDDNWAHWAKYDNVTSTVTGGGAGAILGSGESLQSTPVSTVAGTSFAAAPSTNSMRSLRSAACFDRQSALDDALAQFAIRQQRLQRRGSNDFLSGAATSFVTHEWLSSDARSRPTDAAVADELCATLSVFASRTRGARGRT